MTEARVADLKLYRKPDGRIDVVARTVIRPDYGETSARLWQWIGGEYAQRHPTCCYWIEDPRAPATRTTEDHLVLGEN